MSTGKLETGILARPRLQGLEMKSNAEAAKVLGSPYDVARDLYSCAQASRPIQPNTPQGHTWYTLIPLCLSHTSNTNMHPKPMKGWISNMFRAVRRDCPSFLHSQRPHLQTQPSTRFSS